MEKQKQRQLFVYIIVFNYLNDNLNCRSIIIN